MKSVKSPFKFLDSYTKNDREVFFGREAEIDKLYEFVYKTNLVLVYGQSGTGKTSLIQCGLVNKFKDTDWFDVHIRRKNNINETLHEELNKSAITPFESSFSLGDKVESIFLDYFKPIYLIFDQFEELYILGSEAERNEFIRGIREILNFGVKCTVIIVMREEYIAHLYDFEKQIPELFDNRLRVEPMSYANVENVIKSSTERFNISLADPNKTTAEIIEKISDNKSGIQLSYLQIYLDRLYREANSNGSTVTFDTELVRKVGSINNVLTQFLDNQTQRIQSELEKKFPSVGGRTVQLILNAFVTLDGTKKPLQKNELVIPNVSSEQIEFSLQELDKARILRLADNYYELSHDTIALHIAEQREGDEVALLEVAKLVQDRFDAFKSTSTFLNEKELQLVDIYGDKLRIQNKLSSDLWEFRDKSKASLVKKRRIRYTLISLAFLVLTFTTIVALVSQNKTAETLLELKAKKELEQQKTEAAYFNYKDYINNGDSYMATSQYIKAQNEYQNAIDLATKSDLKVDAKRALDGIQECEEKIRNKGQFESLQKRGEKLKDLGGINYLEALKLFEQAKALEYNDEIIEEKIIEIRVQLPLLFEEFKERGLKHFKVKGYKHAIEEFKNAQRIKPENKEIKGLIRRCYNNLKN